MAGEARILVVMAMAAEAAPIIAGLELRPETAPERSPFQWHRGAAATLQIMVAVNGVDRRAGVDSIGRIPAALNADAAIRHFAPHLVISAGTAGGWARHGTEIGDVFLNGREFVHHDRRIDIPGFEEYGIGRYRALDVGDLAAQLGFKTGVVTTSDSLDESPTDADQIERLGGRVKEMEAAAVAYVAELHSVPVMAIKAITDLVDSPVETSEQFLANLETASERLNEAVVSVLLELERDPGRLS